MSTVPPFRFPSDEYSRTRRSLLSRLRNGDDRDGWREFMDRYGRFIYAMARRAGFSNEEAEDVVQETLVAVARRIPGFRYEGEKGSFKAWLVMIIRSRIADQLRKKYRRLPGLSAASGREEDGTRLEERIAQHEDALSHEAAWQEEWESHVLETALQRVRKRVPAKHLLAFRMCSQQAKSPSEVGAALGLSLPTVYLIRHRVGRLVAEEIAHLREGS